MIKKVERKYLEIKSIENLKISQPPNNSCIVQLVNPPDFQLNKFFYKQIGKKHRWLDRLEWNENKWMNREAGSRDWKQVHPKAAPNQIVLQNEVVYDYNFGKHMQLGKFGKTAHCVWKR